MAAQGNVLPQVSVVIPTYRHRDYVLLTLESVWAQSFSDFEVIVVNDGSPDDTASLLSPLADAGRIQYIEQANGGQAAARNRGIAVARGELIALLDDDDLWPPDKLEWQVHALHDNPQAVVVYGSAVCVDASGTPVIPRNAEGQPITLPWEAPTGDVYTKFVERNWILSPGQCLIRRSALGEGAHLPFDPDPALRGCDDWDLWLHLAERGPFLFQERESLRYRFHAGNASRDMLQMHRATLRVYRKRLALRAAALKGQEYSAALRHAYKNALDWSAHDLLKEARADRKKNGGGPAGDHAAALAKLRFLLRTQPRFLMQPGVIRSLLGAYRAVIRQQREQSRKNAIVSGDCTG
jgi:glycosyltransferase involved in cell wall biosynthesis